MQDSNYSPIALFTYNRPLHTERSLKALAQNKLAQNSKLYIFSDAAKNNKDIELVKQVRNIIRYISGFKEVKIIEQTQNRGLANSIITGVTQILESSNKVIVLEDDLLTSPNFLIYMNKMLIEFENTTNIMSIGAYCFPFTMPEAYNNNIFLSRRFPSWGWGTWRDKWRLADWEIKDFEQFSKSSSQIKEFNRGGNDLYNMLLDQKKGLIDSWAIRWAYAHFKHQSYSIVPTKSKILNIGADGSGIHVGKTSKYLVEIDKENTWTPKYSNLQPNLEIENNMNKFLRKSLLNQLSGFIKRNILWCLFTK